MTVGTALRAHVLAESSLDAFGDRVYPVRRPQGGALPALVYHRISSDRISGTTHDDAPETPRWSKPLFQLDVLADDHDEAEALGRAVIATFHGLRGTMGAGAETIRVGGVLVEGDRHDLETDTDTFRWMIDVRIPHEEA